MLQDSETSSTLVVMDNSQASDPDPQKVEFVERKAEETFRYVLESYDLAKAEGKNVLQWLFAAVIGGVGLTGTLVQNSYCSVAVGALAASAWSAWQAHKLIKSLRSYLITPPGNEASSLKSVMHCSLPKMRLLEAEGLEEGTEKNRKTVDVVARGVDKARNAISWIPVWFLGAADGTRLFEPVES